MGEVAVALANWNGMQYIGRCLDSVFAQTCAPREVVIVDNGSTDGSFELAKGYTRNNKVQLHQYTSVNNVAGVRSHGIKRSKGEYLAFIDSDDIWISSKILSIF